MVAGAEVNTVVFVDGESDCLPFLFIVADVLADIITEEHFCFSLSEGLPRVSKLLVLKPHLLLLEPYLLLQAHWLRVGICLGRGLLFQR